MKTIKAIDLVWIVTPARYRQMRRKGLIRVIGRRPLEIGIKNLAPAALQRYADAKGKEITERYLSRRDEIVSRFFDECDRLRGSSSQYPADGTPPHELAFHAEYDQNLRKNLSERRRLRGICDILGLKTNSLPDYAPLCSALLRRAGLPV